MGRDAKLATAKSTLPEQTRALVNALVDAACVVDRDLELLHANPQFLRLVGLRPRDLRRNTHARVCCTLLELDACKDGCPSTRSISSGIHLRLDEIEARAIERTVIVTSIPLKDPIGTPYAAIEIYRDVTAEARMQLNYRSLLDREKRYNEILREEVQNRTAELEQVNSELTGALAQMAQMARTDALTGLFNRRHFQECLDRELRRADRSGQGLALLLLDLDKFKGVNDTFGHQVGDVVLKSFSRLIGRCIRTSDMAARIGGEEFAVLLFDTAIEGALETAERIRDSQETSGLHCTVSVGVGSTELGGLDGVELFRTTDAALYRAKDAGRNRVELAKD